MPEHRTSMGIRRTGRGARGVVLLALQVALALGGIAAVAAMDVWSLERQRMREQELLFVGEQYRQAIQRYYSGAPPGAARVLPASLEALLEDDRYPVPVRHLRRLYADPITGSAEWGVLRVGGRIAGVHSLSAKEPVKQAGFAQDNEHFNGKTAYRDWTFATSISGRPIFVNPPSGGTPGDGIAPPESSRPVRRAPS